MAELILRGKPTLLCNAGHRVRFLALEHLHRIAHVHVRDILLEVPGLLSGLLLVLSLVDLEVEEFVLLLHEFLDGLDRSQVALPYALVVGEHEDDECQEQQAHEDGSIDEEPHLRHLQRILPEHGLLGLRLVGRHQLRHLLLAFLPPEAVGEGRETLGHGRCLPVHAQFVVSLQQGFQHILHEVFAHGVPGADVVRFLLLRIVEHLPVFPQGHVGLDHERTSGE